MSEEILENHESRDLLLRTSRLNESLLFGKIVNQNATDYNSSFNVKQHQIVVLDYYLYQRHRDYLVDRMINLEYN